jgi:hypothetical protein
MTMMPHVMTTNGRIIENALLALTSNTDAQYMIWQEN